MEENKHINDDMDNLEKRSNKLKVKADTLKKYSLFITILGAVVATSFVILNKEIVAIMVFGITALISIALDSIKRILMILAWKFNKKRNRLLLKKDMKNFQNI